MQYKDWSLDRWVSMFVEIYGKQNKRMSDDEIWLHVVEEVAELAEDLRKGHIKPRKNKKGELEGVLVNIADAFAWVCAFASRRGSLEKIVWRKFPNICHYCFSEEDCLCIARMSYIDREQREERLETYRQNLKQFPKTLNDWQQMFNRIYGNVNRLHSVDQVGFHMMEEVGEVAKAVRQKLEEELKDEIADVFAWIVGLTIKAEAVIGEEVRFDTMIWERYPNICPHCKSNPCNEEIYVTGPRDKLS